MRLKNSDQLEDAGRRLGSEREGIGLNNWVERFSGGWSGHKDDVKVAPSEPGMFTSEGLHFLREGVAAIC